MLFRSQAIANVYEEAIRQDKDAKKVNPMELWDLHYIRRLDDMGFVDALYGHGSKDAEEARHHHADAHLRGETANPTAASAVPAGAVSTVCDDEDCGAKH